MPSGGGGFSGDYNDLTNTPTIPTNTSDLTNNSGFITNPDDADADATNELQDWTNLPNIPAVFRTSIDDVDDADADATNELQTLSVSATGDTLYLQNGGFVIIPGISAANSSGGGRRKPSILCNGCSNYHSRCNQPYNRSNMDGP